MDSWYYVSYNMMDSGTGATVSVGGIEWEMSVPPRDMGEVMKLSQRIKAASTERGTMRGDYVHVIAWSRLGV